MAADNARLLRRRARLFDRWASEAQAPVALAWRRRACELRFRAALLEQV